MLTYLFILLATFAVASAVARPCARLCRNTNAKSGPGLATARACAEAMATNSGQ